MKLVTKLIYFDLTGGIDLRRQKRNFRPILIAILLAIVVLPLMILIFVGFEGEDPQVAVELSTPYVGSTREIPVVVSDAKSGIRKIWIAVLKDGKETVLASEETAAGGLLRRGQVHDRTIRAKLDPEKLAGADGEAMLRVKVWDHSWRGWLDGNSTYIEEKIIVDTRAPVIDVLTRAHNINQGGSGLVVYRLSEPCDRHGVLVGQKLYPGRTGHFDDKSVYLALVAVDDRQGTDTELAVTATDPAGNTARAGFYYNIRRKKFRADVINISDGFLNAKMPEFHRRLAGLAGASKVDQFLEINRNLRQENYRAIQSITAQSQPIILWQGKFGRLPNAAPRAGYGDRRVYKIKGKEIDRQTHLGIDLASLANATVPAANGGSVVFADYLGIYGNTVIIDHGLGLFSMYSHLSQMAVSKGDAVEKGATVGKTGATGMAGGDHLHFSILVNDTFVNPIEWWDARWIKHNITDKLADVKLQLGRETTE
jgi:murein DD-endopeptidase MepM/ murein hydrolase activator NlpD